jgi:hydroxymethylpyrimidine/phosphomethylpyrimidine kinase
MVRDQLAAVFEELTPTAAKTGMLFSAAIIHRIADWLQDHRIPLVVDPVIVSTSGARLLAPPALDALRRRLLPLASLITPNLSEAEVLTGTQLRSVQDLRAAAKQLYRRFGVAVLVKGGHLKGLREATDIFYDGNEELFLRAPFVRGIRTHGTGCAYSAAITAYLAAGVPLLAAVSRAKQFITQAIAQSHRIGRHRALNSFWLPHRWRA